MFNRRAVRGRKPTRDRSIGGEADERATQKNSYGTRRCTVQAPKRTAGAVGYCISSFHIDAATAVNSGMNDLMSAMREMRDVAIQRTLS